MDKKNGLQDKAQVFVPKRDGLLKRMWDQYGLQFIRFGCVGAVNTLVDYAVFWLSNQILGESILLGKYNYLIAQLLGFVAGTLNAWFMNGRFVFKDKNRRKEQSKTQLWRSFIGYGFTFGLSELLLWLLVSRFGLNKYLAKLMIMCVTIPLNFVINRFWIFKKTAEEE